MGDFDQALRRETIVDDRYRILERIGSGGMADVYCAEDQQLGRRVALKLLHRRFSEDQEFVERFRREASAAAGLQHPNVVQVFDRGAWDGTYYLAMELLEGRSLKQLIRDEAPLEAGLAVDIAIQVLKAARFAHKRGVIHRDIKPHNVIVDPEGRVKVTDFGIARAGASDMTETGAIMGTAQYLSPEQAQGHAVSAPADLYSVGIVLYEMLTGRLPFEADSAVTIALKQVNEDPLPLRAVNPGVSPELEDVVLRALRKDPRQRYADADEFMAALEAARDRPAQPGVAQRTGRLTGVYAAVEGPLVMPDEPYRALEEEDRRSRRPWLWLLAALAVAALAIGAYLLLRPDPVPVPNVVGLSADTAAARLNNAGFEVDIEEVRSADVPRNRVTRQRPNPEELAETGSIVTIFVSEGPGERAVPDVLGRTQRDATRALRRAGFEVEAERVYSDTVQRGRVVETRPGPLTRYEIGRTVTLVVSRGREQVAVPRVVRLDRDEAERRLRDAELDVSIQERESEDEEPGTVLEQDPAAGTRVEKGSNVTLVVATESTTALVPEVVGEEVNDALAALDEAGFGVRQREREVETPGEDGTVVDQSPDPGERRRKGSRVTITVGRFDPDLDPDPTPTPSPAPTPTP